MRKQTRTDSLRDVHIGWYIILMAMLIHSQSGCNFTQIMDGFCWREHITSVFFFFPAQQFTARVFVTLKCLNGTAQERRRKAPTALSSHHSGTHVFAKPITQGAKIMQVLLKWRVSFPKCGKKVLSLYQAKTWTPSYFWPFPWTPIQTNPYWKRVSVLLRDLCVYLWPVCKRQKKSSQLAFKQRAVALWHLMEH